MYLEAFRIQAPEFFGGLLVSSIGSGSRIREIFGSVCSRGGMRIDQMLRYSGQNLRRSYTAHLKMLGVKGLSSVSTWFHSCGIALPVDGSADSELFVKGPTAEELAVDLTMKDPKKIQMARLNSHPIP